MMIGKTKPVEEILYMSCSGIHIKAVMLRNLHSTTGSTYPTRSGLSAIDLEWMCCKISMYRISGWHPLLVNLPAQGS